jgi:hypothetical protein
VGSEAITRKNGKLAMIGIWNPYWGGERRSLIRMTYLTNRPMSMDHYFFLCMPPSKDDRLWITFESNMFNDIIAMRCHDNSHSGKIWNFIQAVRYFSSPGSGNYSYASLIESSPSRAATFSYDFIIKVDDDSYLHLPNLESRLLQLNRTATYFGRFWYKDTSVPFATGMMYALSYDLVAYLAATIKNESSVINGPEDYLVAAWLTKVHPTIVDDQTSFYAHIGTTSQIRRAFHRETICVHRLKTNSHFLDTAVYFLPNDTSIAI